MATVDTIRSNTISNVAEYGKIANASNEATVAGIRINVATTNLLVPQNTIHTIRADATVPAKGTTAAGILVTDGEQGRIEKSAIYNIKKTFTGTCLVAAGIVVRNVGQSLIMTNNMISLGLLPDGSNNSEDALYVGVWNNFSSTSNCYFIYDSVTLDGLLIGSYNNYGFLKSNNASGSITTLAYVINNLFYNACARSSSGTGKHFAIANQIACTG